MSFDLLIRGGRLIDPASGTDAPRDVAFAEGRVAAIAPAIPPDRARQVIDAAGALVTPGLIDLHVHCYWGGTPLGIDADRLAAASGVTTFVDAGSAGAGNFLGFRRHVIERARPRILAFLNISFAGIYGFSNRVMVGECGDLRLLDAREAVACIADHGDLILGVKVRAGRIAGGASGAAPFEIALEAADQAGLPLMTHLDEPPPGRDAVLARMRPGDILTHCCRPFPNAGVDRTGAIRAEVLAARARGVRFDIGHGMGSFSFEVARAMMAGGFLPDVISSDLHLFCVDGPAYDLPVCISKFLALGLPLGEAIAMTTQRPAEAIGRPELGRLAVGLPGDAAVLALEPGAWVYRDVTGATLTGSERLASRGVVIGGRWIANDGPDRFARAETEPPAPDRCHADALRRHFGDPRGGAATDCPT